MAKAFELAGRKDKAGNVFFNGRHHVKFTGEITDAAPDQMDKCSWF